MPHPMKQGSPIPYSKWTFALPFGQYEAGGEQEPPADEVLIGREGQRAYLIDLLLNMGRRGAYLVTGRRGAGKTSFVKHCIAEYRAEVFGRFVRSSVGRALFWDRIIVYVLGLAAIIGALLLSQLMGLLVGAVADKPISPATLLVWLLIAPMALLCFYPLLYAKEVLEVVIGAFRQETNREDQKRRLLAVLVFLGLACAAWYVGPFGSAALGLSRLGASICGIYLLLQATSYRVSEPASTRPEPPQTRWKDVWPLLCQLLGVTVYLLFGAAPFLPEPEKEFWFNLAIGFLLFSTGSGLRAFHLRTVAPLDELPSGRGGEREISHAMRGSSLWYLLLAALSAGVGLFILVLNLGVVSALRVLAPAMALLIGCWWWLRRGIAGATKREEQGFKPRPLHALVAKAAVSIVLSLQLVQPVLSRWPFHLDLNLSSVEMSKPAQSLADTYLWGAASLHEVARQERVAARNRMANAAPVRGRHVTHTAAAESDPPGRTAAKTLTPAASEHISLGVFHGERQELAWILVLLLLSTVVFFLEYEWVVRPFARQRIDRSFAPEPPAPWEDQRDPGGRHDWQRAPRELASLTLPWLVYDAWLPVFVLSVNLGFDRLDHRRVVHAMLAALRDVYHRTFLGWSSALANLGRFFGLLLLLVMVSLVGDRLFVIHADDLGKLQLSALSKLTPYYAEPCTIFQGRQIGASVANLVCSAPGGNRLFHFIYFDLLGSRTASSFRYSDHLLFTFFPYQDEDLPPGVKPPLLARGLHFRVYHLMLLVLFGLIGRWLFHRLPVLPYQEALNRIDAMLDNLSSRTSVSSKKTRWKLAQWLQGYFADENVREKQQDPVDPRTVEFAFLSILQDIQSASVRLPGAKNQRVSLPAPEITFIFDELDKLGTRLGPQEAAAGGSKQESEILDAERRRSLELHKLLANMKNLLSSAPARFIFVGGRNMHDEWLADQTARHPHLTNIFNAEVYLPSLVTDHRGGSGARLHHRIAEFLLHQERRAQILYCRWAKTQWLPSFALPLRDLGPESFVPSSLGVDGGIGLPELVDLKSLCILPCQDTSPLVTAELGESLLLDFVYFMTYRSMGNPKKLKELMASFVRPVGRVVKNDLVRRSPGFDCRHVLQFGDLERFRVQLLADIYRHLALTSEERLVYRDDKVATSVFYLADFLFKFHGRAFSWSNLERVDELIHIHRAPDLREVLEEIVERWSERFLHPIRNGMYAFRFRSDIAREVEYLSRQSADEMAAFNFTLDESQALKSLYESRIQQIAERASQELQDLVGGLGELHEFDQEYETARLYYRRSIQQLDAELVQVLGNNTENPSIPAILRANDEGLGNARRYMTWGIARLRLMLQVGMTFEHTRNLERAAVEYRNARTLAHSLVLAMLGGALPWEGPEKTSDASTEKRLHMLKNLNLLFQPPFAEAWVAEKLPGSVDTSISLVERELRTLRQRLPFVCDRSLFLSRDAARVRDSNFALIIAELHNKAGDLYFFKGRQLVSFKDLRGIAAKRQPGEIRKGSEGYLLRAHYHYAVGLHELGRFITHRRASSRYKFNIWSDPPLTLWNTISEQGWPDFVFRSAGGMLNDLAESMLGRVSLFGLYQDLAHPELLEPPRVGEVPQSPKEIKNSLVDAFGKWLERRKVTPDPQGDGKDGEVEVEDFPIRIPIGQEILAAGTLQSWLGVWDEGGEAKQLLRFSTVAGHEDAQRLLVSLHFSLVGAKYLERGGYLEDAATELIEVGETVAHYLWWGFEIKLLHELREKTQPDLPVLPDGGAASLNLCGLVFTADVLRHPYWHYTLRLALYALRKADQLFRRSRRAEQATTTNLVGDKIPPSLLTLACSLGLVALQVRRLCPQPAAESSESATLRQAREHADRVSNQLASLVGGWIGRPHGEENLAAWFELLLEQSLIRHGYPMINRLHALKVLVDSAVLAFDEDGWQSKRTRILAQASELLGLAEQFDASMHFTPLQSGITFALVDLCCRAELINGWRQSAVKSAVRRQLKLDRSCHATANPGTEELCETMRDQWRQEAVAIEALRQAAQRALNTSEEMYTMRRAYYEAISDLYYLFDDFNDRQIHFNAAIQMAGTEIVSLLKGLLHLPEAIEFRRESAEEPTAWVGMEPGGSGELNDAPSARAETAGELRAPQATET